jgi:hypothetical protein
LAKPSGRFPAGAGERAQVIASFTLVNWLVGLSGAPQIGSAGNYLYAGLIGCALLLPFTLLALREHVKSVAALVLIIFGLYHVTVMEADETHTVLAAQANFAADPYRTFAPYHILSDKPVFALYGRNPDLLDPLSLHIMQVAGNWSSAPIAAEVRSGGYDFVILACGGDRSICSYRGVNFFSGDVIRAINENYSLFCSNRGKYRPHAALAHHQRRARNLHRRLRSALRHEVPGTHPRPAHLRRHAGIAFALIPRPLDCSTGGSL